MIFLKKHGLPFLILGINGKTINHFKKISMKNSFKVGVLALAIAVSFVACKSKSASGSADSLKAADSAKTADSLKMASDTSKKDTSKKDTSKMKMADTTKKK